MEPILKHELSQIGATIRELSIEAIQKANSGHPGMPMGCAELGAYLYGVELRHNPKQPKWINRDRLVLSVGHGSIWLYSCLHLSGFDLTLSDLKQFRQLGSRTPGHPEYGVTDGVEATTGLLGQGVGNSVGMALGMKLLAARFNRETFPLFTGKVFCLAGDGDFMEGVCSEASSLAGHLVLNNLILIYDSNQVCLDGPIWECFSEDIKGRYLSIGWEVYEIDGYNFDQMEKVFGDLRKSQERPALVIVHTIIGKGSPNKAGSNKMHGTPLGFEEIALVKEAYGLPQEEPFFVPPSVYPFFEKKREKQAFLEEDWHHLFRRWELVHPDLAKEYKKCLSDDFSNAEEILKNLKIEGPIAGRAASQVVVQALAPHFPQLIGGSADLSVSDLTAMKEYPIISPPQYIGRNIKYGVREFGMATIANGLSTLGFYRPFCGTFLIFSDYMRSAIRFAALSKYPVIFNISHDSIFLGEDGPTHQPIEQLISYRAMPELQVIRPGDPNEIKAAWVAALQYQGPTLLIVCRQNLSLLSETNVPFSEGMGRGAYLVKKETRPPDFTLFATGSELALALQAAQELEQRGKSIRVVSMPCWFLFEKQSQAYKDSLLEGDLGLRVAIEAASDLGWHKYIGRKGICLTMKGFGASAPPEALAKHFGFTVQAIVEKLLKRAAFPSSGI